MLTPENWTVVGVVLPITIALLAVGVSWGMQQQQMKNVNRWIEGHERYSQLKDQEMVLLRESNAKLSMLADQGAQRLKFIEDVVLATLAARREP